MHDDADFAECNAKEISPEASAIQQRHDNLRCKLYKLFISQAAKVLKIPLRWKKWLRPNNRRLRTLIQALFCEWEMIVTFVDERKIFVFRKAITDVCCYLSSWSIRATHYKSSECFDLLFTFVFSVEPIHFDWWSTMAMIKCLLASFLLYVTIVRGSHFRGGTISWLVGVHLPLEVSCKWI